MRTINIYLNYDISIAATCHASVHGFGMNMTEDCQARFSKNIVGRFAPLLAGKHECIGNFEMFYAFILFRIFLLI